MNILLFLLLVLSCLGYVAFSRAYLGIPPRASYLFSLSLISLVMYYAGLAGLLEPAANVLYGLGFVLLAITAVLGGMKRALAISTRAINVVFFLCTAYTFVTLAGYSLIHYDNFSHWALVVKYMLVTGHIPDAAAAIIDFTSYPTGTASFIYYVCRFAGHTEGMMLVAQAALIIACFYAIFGVIRDSRRFMLAALLGMCMTFLTTYNISIRINNLLVDFLLPLYALGAIGCMCASREDIRTAGICSAPAMAMLLIVKTTGLFFILPCIAYLVYAYVRARRLGRCKRSDIAFVLLAIAFALAAWGAWQVHTSTVFAGRESKFSYDLSSLDTISSDKTPEEIDQIISLFISTTFSPDQLPTRGILLFNILGLLLWLNATLTFRKKWRLLWILLLLDAMIVVYYAGILAMYILSMPIDEALRLAGFDRYASSMVLLFIGAMSMCLTRDVEFSLYMQQGRRRNARAFKSLKTKKAYQFSAMAFSFIGAFMLFNEMEGMNTLQEGYDDTLPGVVSTIIADNWSGEDDARYLLYASDTDGQISDYYLQYVSRYRLFAAQADAVSSVEDAAFADYLDTYDRFIIVEKDDTITQWMRENAGIEAMVGTYRVDTIISSLQGQIVQQDTDEDPIVGDDAIVSDEAVSGDDAIVSDEASADDDANVSDEAVSGDDAIVSDEAVSGDDAIVSDEAVSGDDANVSDEALAGDDMHADAEDASASTEASVVTGVEEDEPAKPSIDSGRGSGI